MRIIGGEYRSRLIGMPKGVDIRPTQDRVREAVFNILGDVNDKVVLDLFAGSGASGIEALSRGAARAVFVDNNSRCTETVRANLESLGIDEYRYDIIRANGLSIFPRLQKEDEKFDLIFIDPPYYKDMARKSLINIDSYDILTQIGIVVVEHFKKDSLLAPFKTLFQEKERLYGDTVITIFRRIPDEVSKDSGISGDV